MRLVLDCNVLIAAARTDGTCRAALGIAVRHHEIVLSPTIADEYREVAATALVTGNTRHFPLELCAPVAILTPRELLEVELPSNEIGTDPGA